MPQAPPTPMAMLIGTALVALVSGYMIGIASSLGLFPNPFGPKKLRPRGVAYYDDEEESEEEEVDETILNHAPNWSNGFEADKRDGLRATAAGTKTTSKTKKGNATKESEVKKEEVKAADWEKSTEECKLVLVVRTDLGMTKGKIAAQCSHATLACYKHFLSHNPQSPVLRRWERQGQAKVALQVKSEDELLTLQATALSLGLVAEVIADAGRTQIEAGSHTVLGIGPAPKSVIDKVTGTLKLL